MKMQITMKEVLGHEEEYYEEEYRKTWRNDFELLERMTKNCSKEETQRLYDMVNGETWELMDMVKYIANNKN